MTDTDPPKASRPDGIHERHIRASAGLGRHASPLSLAAFGLVIALGLTGLLGRERDWTAEADGAGLTVHAPEIIRNGEFFEMRVTVDASTPVDELAIVVDTALWEDMTVNTMIPAATEEISADSRFRFTFGPLEAGATFEMKVDLQVNPDILGGNRGAVTVYDGDEPIAGVDVAITVLP